MSGQCWAVVSGKGGVGKSMLAIALGALWKARGKRVALVDLNTGVRGLDMLLGLENRIVFDLGDVLGGLCGAKQALVRDKRTGLSLIAAQQITDSEMLDEAAFSALVETLREMFDIVLLDAATGIGRGFTAAAQAADQALLIATPDDMALRDADRVAALLGRLEIPSPALVINRIREGFVDSGLQYEPAVCAQVLDLRVMGVIPDDAEVWRHSLEKKPAIGDFPAAAAIENLLLRLEDEAVPLRPWRAEASGPAFPKGPGLFERFRRKKTPARKETL